MGVVEQVDDGVRGARGGYRLARPAAAINAYDVVTAMEGSIAPVSCVEEDHVCGSQSVCGTQNLWQRVDTALRDVLGGTTLADLTNHLRAAATMAESM